MRRASAIHNTRRSLCSASPSSLLATGSSSSFVLSSTSTFASSRINLHAESNLRSFSSSSTLLGEKKERPILMIPGPIEFSEKVLAVMAEPTYSHVSPEFIEIFGSVLTRVRNVFLASKDSQPFVLAGSGTSGWDMAAANVLERGDRALVVSTGYFGDRFGECLQAYGAEVTYARAAVGDIPTLEQFERSLGAPNTYKLVTLTHVDTSTGLLTDVKSFAQVARRHSPNILIVVDGVCATGAEELRMEEWEVDITLTGSQKALGAPPGLSILVAGPRALAALQNRKTPVLNYFNDWNKWIPVMKAYESRTPSYFATPAVNLIRALSVSLDEILGTSRDHVDAMNARFKTHRDAGVAVRKAVKALGLNLVAVREGIEANTISAIRFPSGVTGPDLLPKIKGYGVELAGGLHPQIKAEYFRVGHMGISVVEPHRKHLEKTVDAIERALIDCGYNKFTRGEGVNAVKGLQDSRL